MCNDSLRVEGYASAVYAMTLYLNIGYTTIEGTICRFCTQVSHYYSNSTAMTK